MKTVAIAVVVLAAASTPVASQTVDLACSGTVYETSPRMGGDTTGAARVDLDNKQMTTPVGTFHIFRVEETAVYFDDPGGYLKVYGYLDRVTGKITIFWRTPEQEAKLQARQEHTVTRYADLRCSVAKRLF